MDKIEQRLLAIETDVAYIKVMLEDMTMRQTVSQDAKKMVAGQMQHIKAMFSSLPIQPEVKAGLDKIFDEMGAK